MPPSVLLVEDAPTSKHVLDWRNWRMCWLGLAAALIALTVFRPAHAQSTPADAIVGMWHADKAQMDIRIEPCGEATYCGRIVALDETPNQERPRVDAKNPDKALRDRPLKGLRILTGLTYNQEGEWNGGTMYVPQRGKHVNLEFQMLHPDTLRANVSKFIFHKTTIWTRQQ